MEFVSVSLARLTALVQIQSLDPFGKASILEAIQGLASSFTFAKYPRSSAEIDVQKGFELADGRMGEIVIDKISIYVNGIVVDTRSSTENSERVLESLLDFVRKGFGANVSPIRRTFTSQIVFRSDMRLSSMFPALDKIAQRLTGTSTESLKHPFQFEPTARPPEGRSMRLHRRWP